MELVAVEGARAKRIRPRREREIYALSVPTGTMTRAAALIHSPRSGPRRDRHRAVLLMAHALEGRGLRVHALETTAAGDSTRLARDALTNQETKNPTGGKKVRYDRAGILANS
jgi:hypothetical protein